MPTSRWKHAGVSLPHKTSRWPAALLPPPIAATPFLSQPSYRPSYQTLPMQAVVPIPSFAYRHHSSPHKRLTSCGDSFTRASSATTGGAVVLVLLSNRISTCSVCPREDKREAWVVRERPRVTKAGCYRSKGRTS